MAADGKGSPPLFYVGPILSLHLLSVSRKRTTKLTEAVWKSVQPACKHVEKRRVLCSGVLGMGRRGATAVGTTWQGRGSTTSHHFWNLSIFLFLPSLPTLVLTSNGGFSRANEVEGRWRPPQSFQMLQKTPNLGGQWKKGGKWPGTAFWS